MNISPEDIMASVPALSGTHLPVSVIESGQHSRVFDFTTHIARVGRHHPSGDALERESKMLSIIGPLLPVPTPRTEIYRIADTIVVVHEKLAGEPLMSLNTLSEDQRGNIAAQLGSFLKTMHTIPIERIGDLDLQSTDHQYWTIWLADVRNRIYPFLDRIGADRFDTQAVAFLESWSNAPGQLIHGDFGCGNILIENGKISGIIDFGGTSIGDPAVDIAGLLASYGEAFVDIVARTYPEADCLRHRSAFYRPAFAAMEALHGIDHDDAIALEAGLATLRV